MYKLRYHILSILFFFQFSIAGASPLCLASYSSDSQKSTLRSMQIFIDQSLSDFQNMC